MSAVAKVVGTPSNTKPAGWNLREFVTEWICVRADDKTKDIAILVLPQLRPEGKRAVP